MPHYRVTREATLSIPVSVTQIIEAADPSSAAEALDWPLEGDITHIFAEDSTLKLTDEPQEATITQVSPSEAAPESVWTWPQSGGSQ